MKILARKSEHIDKQHGKQKSAFTLAEVLITLGIIGIVAAMTLPTLMANYRRTEAETRLKKAYTVLNQAFSMAVVKHGDVDGWNHRDHGAFIRTYLAPEIRGVKVFPRAADGKRAMCYSNDSFMGASASEAQYSWLSGGYISTPMMGNYTVSMSLPDGVCIGLNTGAVGGWPNHVFVDINGSTKGPNKAGHDLFIFLMRDNRVVPYGFDWTKEALEAGCHSRAQGYACAAYVMSQGWEINYW